MFRPGATALPTANGQTRHPVSEPQRAAVGRSVTAESLSSPRACERAEQSARKLAATTPDPFSRSGASHIEIL